MEGSGELQCVGRLEVAKPSKPVGFLCGTLPVPTDAAFPFTQSALVPTTQTVRAPRYQMLPTETDLNTLPLLPNIPEVVFPAATNTGDIYWENSSIRQDLSRKCEALAVSGLVEYGDEIDVVAPADILKQIFKIPYSKARLSIAVHRIGDTLILNAGPDVEEGEKMSRRQSSQSKGADPSIFLNFAVHSVRAEACDCPPTHCASEDQPSSTILPGHFGHREGAFVSSSSSNVANSQLLNTPKEGFSCPSEGNQEKFFWGTKQKQNKKRRDTTRKTSQVGEKPRCPVQESDKCRKVGNNGFLRVLFWQFHNFRMLLGSDLLLFSNDKYVAVSLHLWDVSRQVTPVTWLEAWLDNVMASVPELAICYHQNGVVQGYELLKTDDIFLLKGISDDGTPAFHPQVVQQNGLSVLRFLQDNCKQDPGAYWLHKSAGEDVIQLYDLSVLPKNHSPDDHSKSSSLLPCQMHKARRDSLFSLGTLLNRIAHRLSLSKAPDDRARCAQFFKKCLDFLGEPDHLVVRAYAHEQFARLILKCYEELDLISEPFLIESEVTVTDMEDDESSVFSLGIFGSNVQDKVPSQSSDYSPSTKNGAAFQCSESEAPVVLNLEENLCVPRSVPTSETTEMGNKMGILPNSNIKDGLAMCQISASAPHVVQTVSDPISSKLAAIHHVSQAIKSLRWKRQLQNTGGDLIDHGSKVHDKSPPVNFSVCICGDADCIEVCDIREWLGKSKMDRKLWKLVLLLGESYLALGEAYKDDGKLHQALKVVELACSVYGSMPQHLEDDSFISSMVSSSPSQHTFGNGNGERNLVIDGNDLDSCFLEKCLPADQVSSSYLFWSKAWMLVGDVYVEFHRIVRSKDIQVQAERKDSGCALRMSNEVVREVKRLKKKLGRYKQNCSTCSLINCSCESDRASSGNSASSSSGDAHFVGYTRKLGRKSNMKKSLHSSVGSPEDGHVPCKMDYVNGSDYTCLQKTRERKKDLHDSSSNPDKLKISSLTGVEEDEAAIEIQHAEYEEAIDFQPTTKDASEVKHGGIFKFLEGPKVGDAEHNLSAAISCYDASCKALGGFPIGSAEVQSVFRKKGWVVNELGRCRLDSGDLSSAEHAFVDAIKAFKEVTDHTNIILINCNLGHGRRALAEEMVSKMEKLKNQTSFQSSYNQAMQRAKLEYSRSLGYYEAAKTELNAIGEGTDPVLRNEVYTQFAHTYLKLGMLLAREVISAEAFESGQFEELSIAQVHPSHDKIRDQKKYEISANDAFREAVSIYESLGELRKQEAAFAYFQLGCYHRDSYLKFLDLDRKQNNNRQKAKWYASLAERNWQKSIDFYGPKTHPVMYLNILLEQSALYLSLSSFPHSNAMLESALCHLLEGRHVVGETGEGFSCDQDPGISKKFWNQLQSLLKKMLAVALSGKSGTVVQGVTINRAGDAAGKLKEMYGISLRSSGLDQLHVMYRVWMS